MHKQGDTLLLPFTVGLFPEPVKMNEIFHESMGQTVQDKPMGKYHISNNQYDSDADMHCGTILSLHKHAFVSTTDSESFPVRVFFVLFLTPCLHKQINKLVHLTKFTRDFGQYS